jgi:hypothetical protein
MAEDRAAMGWASRDPAAIEERFALTVVGLLVLREAQAAVPHGQPEPALEAAHV